MKPELLSPAGNMICLKAAVLAGCDAVYLGGKTFGARTFANNFDNEELVEAINYCHLRGVKVYVTVNTIIYENEVDNFLEYVDFLHKNNVDALIIQDIGMMDLIRKTYPNLELHASTQMHIHNLDGVKFIEKMGLKRAVLARETDIDTIKYIKKNTNVELEIFIHGALCISYSGECLMSSLIGGRSGNRGSCAGTCRQMYSLIGNKEIKNKYLLSTKDLCTLENIDTLIDIGVNSLKIEGRMKSASYVYMVTKIYREAVDSYISTGKIKINQNDLYDLKKIFNRTYTKGFLFKENDITNDYRPNHLGVEIGNVIEYKNGMVSIKLIDEINVNDGIRFVENDLGLVVTNMICNDNNVKHAKKNDIIKIPFKSIVFGKVVKTTDYLLNNNIEKIISNNKRIPIDGIIETYIDKPIKLLFTDGKNEVIISGKNIQKALKSGTSKERIKEQISKLGNTAYYLNNLKIIGDDNIFINIIDLNNIRNECVELLNKKRLYNIEYIKEKYGINLNDYSSAKEYNVYIRDSKFYNEIKKYNFKNIYCNNIINDSRFILKLDRVMDCYDIKHDVLVGELGGIGSNTTDYSLNVVNSYSVALLHYLGVKKVTLSYEMNYNQIKDLVSNYEKRYQKHPNLELIVFGKEESMISKFNINNKYNVESKYLKDRFNNLYPIYIDNYMHIYNYQTRNIKNYDDYFKIGINSIRFNIIDEEDLKKFKSIDSF